MILGIGADLCFVERIRRSLNRFGDAWIDQLFSKDERRLCGDASDPALLFARGFCGKEACAKALGTGVANGIDWRHIEVLRLKSDTALRLSGDALATLDALTPAGLEARLHITCSGDRRMAQAVVVVSAVHPH